MVISSAKNAPKVNITSLSVGEEILIKVDVVHNLGVLIVSTLSMHVQAAHAFAISTQRGYEEFDTR